MRNRTICLWCIKYEVTLLMKKFKPLFIGRAGWIKVLWIHLSSSNKLNYWREVLEPPPPNRKSANPLGVLPVNWTYLSNRTTWIWTDGGPKNRFPCNLVVHSKWPHGFRLMMRWMNFSCLLYFWLRYWKRILVSTFSVMVRIHDEPNSGSFVGSFNFGCFFTP